MVEDCLRTRMWYYRGGVHILIPFLIFLVLAHRSAERRAVEKKVEHWAALRADRWREEKYRAWLTENPRDALLLAELRRFSQI